MNLFSSIIATGIPGFLSYIYLSRLGILNYTKDEKDEKIIVLTILSLINMGTSMVVFYYLAGKKVSADLEVQNFLLLFLIAVLVSGILTMWIYPFFINRGNQYISDYQKSHSIPNKSTKTVYEVALFSEGQKYPFIYIFDFDNKFIESGFVYRLSGTNEKLNIALTNTTGHTNDIFEIKEILETFENWDNDKAEIIIDIENKLKIFVFYS